MDAASYENPYARLDGIIDSYGRLDPAGQAYASIMTAIYTKLPALISRDAFKRQVLFLQFKGGPGLRAMRDLHRGLNRKISMFDGSRAALEWLKSRIDEIGPQNNSEA